MSHWNHRVVKAKYEDGTEYFSVRETHYNDDGSIYGYIVGPSTGYGETLESLKEYCAWMLKACDLPVLVDGEVEFVDHYPALSDEELIKLTDLEELEDDIIP
jgi:hypothetical protein